MLMIRFQRIGRKNDPAYRIVLLEKARAAKTGQIVEQLGTYNPKTKAVSIEADRVKEWVSKGAQVSDTVHNLFVAQGVVEGKKINVIPKKVVNKKVEDDAAAVAKAKAEAEEAAKAPAPEVVAEAPKEADAPEPAVEEEKKEEAEVAAA